MEEKKKKKPFYKRWWFIALVIIIVIGVIGSGGEETQEEPVLIQEQGVEETTADVTEADIEEELGELQEEPETTKFGAGNYKVGEDIPAGEYKIFTDDIMGYFEVSKDSSGNLDSIITNDNFTTFTYLTVSDGQYLKLQMCYAIPIEEVKPYNSDNGYGPGMYKVGYDIPEGEYNVKKEEGELFGYVEISKDSRGTLDSIITNDNFEANNYITVQDGQYLKLQFAYIE